jgi:hypothetical protein
MRRFVASTLSPIVVGDTGREGGADFALILVCSIVGSDVVHISQTRKDGLLRKVHAGQVIPSESSFVDGGPGKLEEDRDVYEEAGRESVVDLL